MARRIIVTGGSGFIGAFLVKRLVAEGNDVCVIDNMLRGDHSRLSGVAGDIEFVNADIRDESAVRTALKNATLVYHLAAINGTENFYKKPELVLDVGIRGMISVVNGCKAVDVPELVVASTAEVYQEPGIYPTPEDVPLKLPNATNPRYSYGASKIASELIAMNYGREHFQKLQIFRPHNVYGPNMGWKHVIPQFIVKIADKLNQDSRSRIQFPIQGKGQETRAFCFVDDVIDGLMLMQKYGGHRETYNIGNDKEVTILKLIETLAQVLGVELEPLCGPPTEGNTPRRCPDISKLRALHYKPKVSLYDGLRSTAQWYLAHRDSPSENALL